MQKNKLNILNKFFSWNTFRHCYEDGHEFFRELLMNVFLYFPLGLTLGELVGWHRIWLALVLAIVIESWQYAAGTGMAQVTDVICNTLGVWIGGIAFQKRKHCL